MDKPTLAERRRELVARCAEQRTDLSFEMRALRPTAALNTALESNPTAAHVATFVAGHKRMVLGGLGVVLGLAFMRRKSLAGLATSALSAWKMAQGVMAMVGRYR